MQIEDDRIFMAIFLACCAIGGFAGASLARRFQRALCRELA